MNAFISLAILLGSDLIGRKRSFQLSGLLIFVGSVLSTLPNNILIRVIGLGICFGSEGALSSLFSSIFNESDCKKANSNSR